MIDSAITWLCLKLIGQNFKADLTKIFKFLDVCNKKLQNCSSVIFVSKEEKNYWFGPD